MKFSVPKFDLLCFVLSIDNVGSNSANSFINKNNLRYRIRVKIAGDKLRVTE